MADDNLYDAVHEIEKSLGLPSNFYSSLLEEDDWSFIIKIHSLVEAAVTHILVVASGKQELINVFTLLELSDNRKGKLAFIKDMNLLEKKYRRFIKTLSELRNSLVHDIKNVGFSFDDYFKKLNPEKRKSFVEAMSLGFNEKLEINGKQFTFKDHIENKPKESIWLATMVLLAEIYISKMYVEIKVKYLDLAEQLMKGTPNPNNKT
ncbi:MAG: hypothetical protein NTW95_14850 [Candidatus Aminicenantes bacterium]|nr:hypothetical protein [Candidatus Aminicenantes bacterium]